MFVWTGSNRVVSGASKMLFGFDLGHSVPLVCSK